MRCRRGPLWVLLLVLAAQPAAARTFYVNPDTGANTNDGTSPSTPWENLPGTRTTNGSAYVTSSWTATGGNITTSAKVACGDIIYWRGGTTHDSTDGGAAWIHPDYYANTCTTGSRIRIKVANDSEWSGSSGHFVYDGTGITPYPLAAQPSGCHGGSDGDVTALIATCGVNFVEILGDGASARLVVQDSTARPIVIQNSGGNTTSGIRGRWWLLQDSSQGFGAGNTTNGQISDVIVEDITETGGVNYGFNAYNPVADFALVDFLVQRTGATVGGNDDDGFFLANAMDIWCIRCRAEDNQQRGFNSGVIGAPGSEVQNYRFRDLESYNNGATCSASGGCEGAGVAVSGNHSELGGQCSLTNGAFNYILGARLWRNYQIGLNAYENANTDVWHGTFWGNGHGTNGEADVRWDFTAGRMSFRNTILQGRSYSGAFASSTSNSPVCEVLPVSGTSIYRPNSASSEQLSTFDFSPCSDGNASATARTYAQDVCWTPTSDIVVGQTSTHPACGGDTCSQTEADPMFTAVSSCDNSGSFPASGCDFTPASGSPAIDAGACVMRTNGAGSTATVVSVLGNGQSNDPRNYFVAPASFLDAVGDTILVGSDAVTITALSASTITVTPAISWADAECVHLASHALGNGPDIGAMESGGSATTTTSTSSTTSTAAGATTSTTSTTTSTTAGPTTTSTTISPSPAPPCALSSWQGPTPSVGSFLVHVCTASPEGAEIGINVGDLAVTVHDDAWYVFRGTPGTTTGWEPWPPPPPSTTTSTSSTSTTSTSSTTSTTLGTCGDGTWNSGIEGCDTSDDASPCQGVLPSGGPQCVACCCVPLCPNGTVETGTCNAQTDENCEFTGGGGGGTVTFGNAIDLADVGVIDTGVDVPFETGDVIIGAFIRVDDTSAATRPVFRGGHVDGTAGLSLSTLPGAGGGPAQLRLNLSDGLVIANPCTGPVGHLNAGVLYHVVVTFDASEAGTSAACTMWQLNRINNEEVHTQLTMSDSTGEAPAATGQNLLFSRTTAGEQFDGLLDEVSIKIGIDVPTYLTAGTMDTDWTLGACAQPNTDFCWTMDEAGTASVTEGVTSTVSTNSAAGWTRVSPSPFTAPGSGGGGGGVEFGCTAPQECNPNSCRCQDPQTSGARTFYVSVTGSDSNPGTLAAPYRTGLYAVNPARFAAGDTAIFLDTAVGGTGHTPFRYLCGDTNPELNGNLCNGIGATAPCGTNTNRITLRCQNERQCEFNQTGADPAVEVGGCQYVTVEGLTATAVDVPGVDVTGANHTLYFHDSRQLTVRRNLGYRNNRCGNNHVLALVNVTDSLIEENEVWENSRHGLYQHGCARNEVRRNYVNTNGRNESAAGNCPPQGGTSNEQLSMYPASDALVEDNLLEDPQGWGLGVQCGGGSWQGARCSSANTIIGNIVANTFLGLKIYTRDGTGCTSTACAAVNANVVRSSLFTRIASSFGIRHSVGVNTLFDNVTIYGGASTGFQSDDPQGGGSHASAQTQCDEITTGPPTPPPHSSFVLSDSIVTGNTGTDLVVNLCDSSAEMWCSITNTQADAAGGTISGLGTFNGGACGSGTADSCACNGNTTTAPGATFGDAGANACLVLGSGGRGAVIRCRTEGGTTLTGTTNNLWANNTQDDNAATCAAQTTSGSVTPCLGGFRFCGATRAPYNTGTAQCKTFAARHLNHTLSSGSGTGCFAGTDAEEIACP